LGGVQVTPGAMGAVGLTILALAFKGLPARELIANLGGGALVYEGVKLGEQQILPRLGLPASGVSPQTQLQVQAGVPTTAGLPMGYGYQPSPLDWQVQQALASVHANF
jgi:hypothetical protein